MFLRLLAVVIDAVVNVGTQTSESLFSVLLGVCQGLELLGHMVMLCPWLFEELLELC